MRVAFLGTILFSITARSQSDAASTQAGKEMNGLLLSYRFPLAVFSLLAQPMNNGIRADLSESVR